VAGAGAFPAEQADGKPAPGYNTGMETVISIPNAVFREAERFPRRTRTSRSQLYVEAIAEHIARHLHGAVTEAMDAVCDRL